ncbi:MAG: hypothetical protein ABIK92_02735 [Pseudomonadota bacterium]
MKKAYLGKWHIRKMDLWDKEFIDLDGPGYLSVKRGGEGILQFGAVRATVDYEVELIGDVERLEFSFEGEDEGDPVCGRGWAQVDSQNMTGKIYFHYGDESGFVAEKE